MWKQFLLNWLTFGTLVLMIQCTKARQSQEMKTWWPKWTDHLEGL